MNAMEKFGGLSLYQQSEQQLIKQLRECNIVSARFGLSLSEQSIAALSQVRRVALAETGRVEFGASVLPEVVDAFCDSPYLMQDEYETTLIGLVEAFYTYKNETRDQIADDELLSRMRACYDAYEGSLDAVSGMTLEELYGKGSADDCIDGEVDEDE